jgi:hypothetical protein
MSKMAVLREHVPLHLAPASRYGQPYPFPSKRLSTVSCNGVAAWGAQELMNVYFHSGPRNAQGLFGFTAATIYWLNRYDRRYRGCN